MFAREPLKVCNPDGYTRREVLAAGVKTAIASCLLPGMPAAGAKTRAPLRVINIMNFIRAEEPRESIDLIQPVREQMALIKAHRFPATWLLQYDALVEGPYVNFLKDAMPPDHEPGIWFEMNRKICDDAGIPWRGNPKWEWDYHVPIAYAIGYTPEERRKLADTAMATFRRIFGHDAKTVASWNLDAVSIAYLADHYGVDAFGNCRDQLATDGFTIWGGPIAAYYPGRKNAWSPALTARNQISTPMFRLLGQDPVYYYDNQLPYPDTMEPVWPSGQSETFVDRFLEMTAHAPTQSVAYAQLGQENSFGWPQMSKAYPMQMDKLARARSEGGLIVETMGETGRRFKRSFTSTPTQAQVMLKDPFGRDTAPQRSIWYQSKYFRANLHFVEDQFYLRDLHVYDDRFPQPYLEEPVRQHGIEQRLLAVLDGYHWSDDEVRAGRKGVRAMGQFVLIAPDGSEKPLTMAGLPTVSESGSMLQASVPLAGGGRLVAVFHEQETAFRLRDAPSHSRLGLKFVWAPDRSALKEVSADQLHYRFRDFSYAVRIANGVALKTAFGVSICAGKQGALRLWMAQQT
ncbi:hypothetical protein [Acidipila rosea]|uniref:Uncharacterized protein n=1 Tax=Acidipila rosea TaxID=768535 RepID=A0A4R1L4A2_9BACT|nr:hypothetical protein [Acidipila rosea]TCK71927.1 hypothetical protein C7378_2549 [Acidipila rosea]